MSATTRDNAKTNLRRSRSRQRGAAMVEGAVVLPVLMIFLPLMTYIKLSYDAKLHNQAMTRRDVAYYAAHNCEGSSASAGAAEPTGIDSSPASSQESTKGDSVTSASSTSMFTATKKRTEQVTHYNITRNVKGESWMMCNDKPRDGSISGWAGYAAGMWSGLGSKGNF